jgi:hypothetical protein
MANEVIKKLLYQLKPIAKLVVIKDGYLRYHVHIGNSNVYFHIPFNDLGKSEFRPEMPAHHLCRWIYANDAAIPRTNSEQGVQECDTSKA